MISASWRQKQSGWKTHTDVWRREIEAEVTPLFCPSLLKLPRSITHGFMAIGGLVFLRFWWAVFLDTLKSREGFFPRPRIKPPADSESVRRTAKKSYSQFSERCLGQLLTYWSNSTRVEMGPGVWSWFWGNEVSKRKWWECQARASKSTQFDVKCGFPFQNFVLTHSFETWSRPQGRKLTRPVVTPGGHGHETIKVIRSQQVT